MPGIEPRTDNPYLDSICYLCSEKRNTDINKNNATQKNWYVRKKTGNVGINVKFRCVRVTIVAVVTCSECVPVALVIQHVMRMLDIVICDLPGCTIFFHIIL